MKKNLDLTSHDFRIIPMYDGTGYIAEFHQQGWNVYTASFTYVPTREEAEKAVKRSYRD